MLYGGMSHNMLWLDFAGDKGGVIIRQILHTVTSARICSAAGSVSDYDIQVVFEMRNKSYVP